MANKPNNKKNLIIGICSAIAIVAIIAVVVVLLLTKGGGFGGQALNDNFFVSDNSKYVLTMSADEIDVEDQTYKPVKTHLVYFYSGDEITGLKYYYEYDSADTANKAYNEIAGELKTIYKDVTVDGKYLIMTSNETDYEGLTADDVKQQLEFMEMIKNMDFDESDNSDDGLVEETVEEDEIVEETE